MIDELTDRLAQLGLDFEVPCESPRHDGDEDRPAAVWIVVFGCPVCRNAKPMFWCDPCMVAHNKRRAEVVPWTCLSTGIHIVSFRAMFVFRIEPFRPVGAS